MRRRFPMMDLLHGCVADFVPSLGGSLSAGQVGDDVGSVSYDQGLTRTFSLAVLRRLFPRRKTPLL